MNYILRCQDHTHTKSTRSSSENILFFKIKLRFKTEKYMRLVNLDQQLRMNGCSPHASAFQDKIFVTVSNIKIDNKRKKEVKYERTRDT